MKVYHNTIMILDMYHEVGHRGRPNEEGHMGRPNEVGHMGRPNNS